MVKLNKKTKQFLGLGSWINDTRKDMPRIEEPEPIPRGRKLNNEEIVHYVCYEGIGFCIFSYISPSKIEDEKLSKLWGSASRAMSKVVEYLYNWELNDE